MGSPGEGGMSAARWMMAAEEAQRRRSESSAAVNDAVTLARNSRHLSLRLPFTSPLSQNCLHIAGASIHQLSCSYSLVVDM